MNNILNVSHAIYDSFHMPLLNHVFDIKDSKKISHVFLFFHMLQTTSKPLQFFHMVFSHGIKTYHFQMVFHMPNWISENKLLISHTKS